MSTYIMLTRLSPEALKAANTLGALERRVVDRVREECPEVEWRLSYAVFGPYDYLDIFTAPDNETAMKVAMIFRTFGHTQTEIWPATEWGRFKELFQSLSTAA